MLEYLFVKARITRQLLQLLNFVETNIKKMKKILFSTILIMCFLTTFAQGTTSSAIGGRVVDDTGTPLLGSNVVVTSINTGVVYGVITDQEGYYRISGLKPGGPYKIEITYTGFENFSQDNIYLQLGQTERFNPTLTSKGET